MQTKKNTHPIYFWICILLLLFFASCGSMKFPMADKPIMKAPSGTFYAGAAEIDITPPPGQPMGGFGNAISQIAQGHWTRLYAKITYLEDADGNYMVLVATDLWSFPNGLGDYVTHTLQKADAKYFAARENIIFTATHTHHSPGNFSSSFGYNKAAAAEPGFDKKLFLFLGNRMVEGIKQAMDNRQAATLSYVQFDIYGLTRNRSLQPFEQNPAALKNVFLNAVVDPGSFYDDRVPCLVTDPNTRYKAVNPQVTSILVRRISDHSVLSMINNFAVHPTILGPQNPLYNSDIYGTTAIILKNYLRTTGSDPVISFTNGESGDISANWMEQSRSECLRLSTLLASAIIDHLNTAEIPLGDTLSYKLDYKRIMDQEVNHDPYGELNCGDPIIKTAQIPIVGQSVPPGAEDGRNTHEIEAQYIVNGKVDECNYPEGKTEGTCLGVHGTKKAVAISLLAAPSAPTEIPVGVFTLGQLQLISLPGEITTVLGHRIKEAVNANQQGPKPILLSLANEYISYFTTPSEYALQHYEGGSTVYGKAAGNYLIEEARRVDTYGRQVVHYTGRTFKSGPGQLNKKKVIKAIKKDWDQIDLTSCYSAEINDPRAVTIQWGEAAEPFEYNEKIAMSKAIPEVAVETFVNGQWKPLTINETFGNRNMAVEQTDVTSLNFLSYVLWRNNGFRWTTRYQPPAGYTSVHPMRMVMIRDNVKIASNTFQIQ